MQADRNLSPPYCGLLRMIYRIKGTKFSQSEITSGNYMKRQTLRAQNENWLKKKIKKWLATYLKLVIGDFSRQSGFHSLY